MINTQKNNLKVIRLWTKYCELNNALDMLSDFKSRLFLFKKELNLTEKEIAFICSALSLNNKSFDEAKKENLHSTMVRFIMYWTSSPVRDHTGFTFHYG